MKSSSLLQRLLRAALITIAAALFVVVAFPHVHDAATSHRTESCRACKIQEAFSADAPQQATLAEVFRVAFESFVLSVEAPRSKKAVSALASRAPPQYS